MLGNHIGPNVRMPPHDLPLLLAKWAWLIQYVVANSDLSQVMKRARSANEFALSVAQFEVLA